ncbi:MAG: GAF domain-containing protein [Clostridia bacterium]
MFNTSKIKSSNKEEFYNLLVLQLKAILEDEKNPLANLANTSALIFSQLENLNWAGFYLMNKTKTELILACFQGNVACTRIPLGKGVCGNAAKDNKTYLVENVHEFPGHIACDSASNSEIVIPIRKNNEVIGVLDIDSPILNRFDEYDKHFLEMLAKIVEESANIGILNL